MKLVGVEFAGGCCKEIRVGRLQVCKVSRQESEAESRLWTKVMWRGGDTWKAAVDQLLVAKIQAEKHRDGAEMEIGRQVQRAAR